MVKTSYLDKLLQMNVIAGFDEKSKIVFIHEKQTPAIKQLLVEKDYRVVKLKRPIEALIDRTGYFEKIYAGISIGNIDISAGTMGWYAVDLVSGKKVGVSNAHVLHPQPWSNEPPPRKVITQPGPYDIGKNPELDLPEKYKIGYYLRHVPIKLRYLNTCPVAKFYTGLGNAFSRIFGRKSRFIAINTSENKVDAGIFVFNGSREYVEAVLLDSGEAYKPEKVVGLVFAGSEIDKIVVISKATNIEKELKIRFIGSSWSVNLGETIYFCGRSSGCQEGKVIATNAKINVFYGYDMALFSDVIIAEMPVKPGDSGSLAWCH